MHFQTVLKMWLHQRNIPILCWISNFMISIILHMQLEKIRNSGLLLPQILCQFNTFLDCYDSLKQRRYHRVFKNLDYDHILHIQLDRIRSHSLWQVWGVAWVQPLRGGGGGMGGNSLNRWMSNIRARLLSGMRADVHLLLTIYFASPFPFRWFSVQLPFTHIWLRGTCPL